MAERPNPDERTAALPDGASAHDADTSASASPFSASISDISFAPPQHPDEIGRLGGYRILKLLGSGGMGAVYLAEDPALHRKIALKLMKPEAAKDPASRTRFEREAQAMAALESDHVVRVYQVGEERGLPFIAMEFLKGKPLDGWLKTNRPNVRQILKIAQEIALGLASAHDAGLIHRDIKPGNIWLESPHGRVKLLDFGLVRAEAADVHVTGTGVLLGTPAYMSPEQTRGTAIDHRTDLFSLGSVLYHLATGRRPFPGDAVLAVAVSICNDDPPAPDTLNADIPPELSALIMRLLAKNPAKRPQTAHEVVESVRAINRQLQHADPTATQPITTSARPATVWEGIDVTAAESVPPAPRESKRNRLPIFATLAALGVMLLLVGIFVTWQIIRISTPKGTLIIETSDPNVEIRILKDGAILLDKSKQREIELKVGTYGIELIEPKGGLKLTTNKFEIAKNGKTTVKVYLEKKESPKLPTADPERVAAEMLRKNFAYLAVRTPDGRIIRVQPSDPLPREPFAINHIHFQIPNSSPALKAKDIVLPFIQSLSEVSELKSSNFRVIFGPDDIKVLTELPCARTLEAISGAFDLNAEILDQLKRIPNLSSIECYGTCADDATLIRIKEFPRLTRLGLAELGLRQQITRKGKEAIAQLPLQALYLQNCRQFDVEFAKIVAAMNSLDELSLYRVPVLPIHLNIIANTKSIKKLRVDDAFLTEQNIFALTEIRGLTLVAVSGPSGRAGAEKLAAALPRCRIEWDGGIIEPKSGPELERKAAEMLNPHADLMLKFADGTTSLVSKGTPLPAAAFRVTQVHVDQNKLPAGFALNTFLPAVDLLEELKEIRTIVNSYGPLRLTPEEFDRLSRTKSAGTLTQLYAHFPLTGGTIDSLKRFPKLTNLLCTAPRIDDAMAAKLPDLPPKLVQFQIDYFGGDGEISEKAIEFFMKMPVRVFGLGGSKHVNNALVARLAAAIHYQDLKLHNGQITDDAISDLLRFKQPITLGLGGNPVTDKLLDGLAGMTNLTQLSVRNTKVTHAGVEKLAAALPRCRILWDGGIIEPKSGPELERKAAEMLNPHADLMLKFADGTMTLVSKGTPLPAAAFRVTQVHVDQNKLPAGFASNTFLPAVELLEELKEIRTIVNSYGPLRLTPEEFDRLSRTKSAGTMTALFAHFPLTASTIDSLKRFPSLRNLLCTAPKIGDALAARLPELPQGLTGLGIDYFVSEGEVPEKAIEFFIKMPAKKLALTQSNRVNNALVARLTGAKQLHELNLSTGQITDDAISDLLRFKQPIAIGLFGNPVTDKLLDGLAGMTNLSQLDLRRTKVTRGGVEKLAAALPKCRILWDGGVIDGNPDRLAMKALEKYARRGIELADGKLHIYEPTNILAIGVPFVVKSIVLPDAEWPTGFADSTLLPALRNLEKLEYIDFGHHPKNVITEAHIENLAKAPAGPSLTSILSAYTPLTPTLVDTYKRFPKLANVSCRAADADDALIEKLLALGSLHSLGLMELGANGKLSAKGRAKIADAPLTAVTLWRPSTFDRDFARMIARQPKLIELALEGDEIIGERLRDLAEGCVKVRVLSLRNATLTDADLETLRRLPALTDLHLHGTKVTRGGVEKLAAALPKCRILWDGGVIERR